ncbi:putative oligosaccharyltransferase alpha subunit [Cutaneotrichosporon oleaginosum]|uniref:Dolichyl-diphosphooligosaccharide--protein glycosyltransferase subunit 1 n=1 Tax=Cutaneotrichosporon oleaginosum TaxID=879819 RepID=A0A0J0XDY3_9TREE|nr:putative oligosaccharyltransferase alpha subunit [Cutaneotrichosporon oleaginosum]KLT39315.1 putative oligosaccharyltransferase alpha subunit [Cutaneotrichosporon oleaginosum]TXT08572.1 hypothetical protein COLE_05496 [Cutaneotrichosporon oleaginosum]
MRLLPFLTLIPAALARAARLQSAAAPQEYVNTAVARTVELGGSTTLVTTQYNVKALNADPGSYILALAASGQPEPAWYEVLVGGKAVSVEAGRLGDAPVAVVPMGKLRKDDTVTISLNAITAHAARPLPEEIEQREPQFMIWESDTTLVDSAYKCDVERIKIRTPTSVILSHGTVPKTYTRDSDVTKSSATITLGPFHGVPPTIGADASAEQSPFYVHYETREPIIGIRTLKRAAEVSYWGANLNIQDEVGLFNDGPQLKGQFSRLAHQQSRFHAGKPAQVLSEFTLRLPPSAHSVYYYDVIGNVSTSRFRPGQPAVGKKRVVDGSLELRPRYPVLGGWNYSFTVGWDMPLAENLRTDGDRAILEVPFLTPLKGVVVDQEELTIVLPEGATDVEVFAPFPLDSIYHGVHRTYLDTIGRPKVVITKRSVTENHAVPVYVTYSYPLSARFTKPLAAGAFAGSALALFMLLRRVNYDIEKK